MSAIHLMVGIMLISSISGYSQSLTNDIISEKYSKDVTVSASSTETKTTTTTTTSDPSEEEEVKRFYFIGTTTVNSTEELLSEFQASQKFLFLTKLIPQKITGDGLDFPIGLDFIVGMNVINLKPKAIPRDSIDFISLMFPETGEFWPNVKPSLHWLAIKDGKSCHKISSEISYCLRQNSIDSVIVKDLNGGIISGPENITFSVINFNFMPIRYTYSFRPDKDFRADISLGFYLNWFNIPNEDVVNFNKLYPINDPLFLKPEKSNIPSVGLKLVCNINGFLFFADLRQNRRTDNFADNNPYKGFVFNTGIAQNIAIFSK